MAVGGNRRDGEAGPEYSVRENASEALDSLLKACRQQVPKEAAEHRRQVVFVSPTHDEVYFPIPNKSQEAIAAIKALEACVAAALANIAETDADADANLDRSIVVNMDKVATFLMSAYAVTLDGMNKSHPMIMDKMKNTDINQAQSKIYRRMSASLHRSRDGGFYHIHGSLDATTIMRTLGLDPFRTDITEYADAVEVYRGAVGKFTLDELEHQNSKAHQAGGPALTWEQFQNTPHGETILRLPPFTTVPLEQETPPVPLSGQESRWWPGPRNEQTGQRRVLEGIKVLELCRIIAGPTIGRSLAAHGASVIKITSDKLPDIPFFQVDVNTGKHCINLDLRSAEGRATMDRLVAEADVLIDGYRPGALARLGLGPERLAEVALNRKRGFVYVVEDCFGGTGVAGAEWAHRAGWQQIADCVTGVADAQGRFMGLSEPVVPPLPMSDYGTGTLGCVAALSGLYRRATEGGSWECRTSLVQYDTFLQRLGLYPAEVCERLRTTHDAAFFGLRHYDSVDEVGRRAQLSVRRLYPHLFGDELLQRAWSRGYKAEVAWPREAIEVQGLRIGHVRATRPNGFDTPESGVVGWEGWEEDEDVMRG